MKSISAGLLVVAICLAVVLGAQTVEWSWGPAFVALGLALLPRVFGSEGTGSFGWLVVAIVLAALWLLGRCLTSPVFDPARGDAMLVMAVVAIASLTSWYRKDKTALGILFGGVAMVSLVNMGMALGQENSPDFIWPYANKASSRPTGFFGHPNYFANFTLGVGLLVAARAAFARDHPMLRVIYTVTASMSLALVVISGSRGGTLAVGVGGMLLLAAAAVIGWRKTTWWSKPLLISLPVLIIAGGAGGWMLLKKVQENRTGLSVMELADNAARLNWISLALKVGSEHSVIGGGSRAFSWERSTNWDTEELGRGSTSERFVHNELVQTFTDYGIVGVVLVLIPLGIAGWLAFSTLFLGRDHDDPEADANAAGIIAAGGAVLIQANVSFVFHLLPSAMLLGLILGMGLMLQKKREPKAWGRWIGVAANGFLVLPILWLGVGGSRALHSAWPVIYAHSSIIYSDPVQALGKLDAAIAAWPGDRLLQEKGNYARIAGAAAGLTPEQRMAWHGVAANAYGGASAYHPYHAGLVINRANALSDLGNHAEAEEAYLEAIRLQGGLEAAFHSRFHFAKHLYALWYQRWVDPNQRKAEEAMWQFQRAITLLDEAYSEDVRGHEPSAMLRERLNEAIKFMEAARIKPIQPPPEVKN